MLDSSDAGTFAALFELCDIANKAQKPLTFWIGAGASKWGGLPTWKELAETAVLEFGRKEPLFDRNAASQFLKDKQYPAVFELCKTCAPKRYASLLTDNLKLPAAPGPVFQRFISALRAIGVVRIITTNVDELLERGLGVQTILPNNLESLQNLIAGSEPFVAKIHGTISDVSTLVFTDSEYKAAIKAPTYLVALRAIFNQSTVVFIGYSLSDEYVVRLISEVESSAPIFGTGPHFACSTSAHGTLPAPIKQIRYIPEPHRDHRSVIQVLDEVAPSIKGKNLPTDQTSVPSNLLSAHMLAECMRPGTWITSQEATLKSEDGVELTMHHGEGLIQSERPFSNSTALHDLAVGLLCFDRVYVPFKLMAQVHDLAGGGFLNELLNADVLRFVNWKTSTVVIYPQGPEQYLGKLSGMFANFDRQGKEETIRQQIHRHIRPAPDKIIEGLKTIDKIESKVLSVEEATPVERIVRGLLLRPSVRALIGMSAATNATNIPKWMMFPILRLASVVRLGNACRELSVASIKFHVGNDKLAGPAFAAAFGSSYAEQIASYVMAGNFNTNLGAVIEQNPDVLLALLRFRESAPGENLRREVFQHLAISHGGDVASAINGGLSKAFPFTTLDSGRGEFAKLSVIEGAAKYPAIWVDKDYSEQALRLWRQRSKNEFDAICSSLRLGAYDKCPCGSGETVRFCCREALNRPVPG